MTYQIGSTTITAEELADMKRMDVDCKFWIKRIQKAHKRASQKAETSAFGIDYFFTIELAAIGVKVL